MIRGDDERDSWQRTPALLCFSTSRSDDMIPRGSRDMYRIFKKNRHLMSFLYHYMSMFLISPSLFFLACFSLYFLVFLISYLLRPVLDRGCYLFVYISYRFLGLQIETQKIK